MGSISLISPISIPRSLAAGFKRFTVALRLKPFTVALLGDPVANQLKFLGRGSFFIQIGAHCDLDDPVRTLAVRQHWSGILVEPVGYIFKKLRRNYSHVPQFKCLNVAVSDERGRMPIYYVDEKAAAALGLPSWFDKTSSLNRKHVAKHFGPEIDAFISSRDIPCMTLPDLLKENDVGRIDLLHIDAEGLDYRILRQLDFSRYRPRAILYERIHLSLEDHAAAHALLAENGYLVSDARFVFRYACTSPRLTM